MEAAELRRLGFHPSQMSSRLVRAGETAFQIPGGADCTMRAVPDADFAQRHGCPGATHMMIGQREIRFGRLERGRRPPREGARRVRRRGRRRRFRRRSGPRLPASAW